MDPIEQTILTNQPELQGPDHPLFCLFRKSNEVHRGRIESSAGVSGMRPKGLRKSNQTLMQSIWNHHHNKRDLLVKSSILTLPLRDKRERR